VGTLLIFTGSPSACVDRSIEASPAASQQLKTEWTKLKRGPVTITLTEQQVTSRGVDYLDAKDVPVEQLQVYFCPNGTAQASAKIKVIGLKTRVVVRGTLDLTGAKPRIKIDEVRAGNLPSSVAKPAVDLILNTGDFRTLDFKEKLTEIRYGDGSATVAGGP